MVRDCRERFGWLAVQQRIPKQPHIVVIAEPHVLNRRSMPDVAACFPTVKAAIDGIVDAGIIPNDTPQHLRGLLFLPAQLSDREGLAIHIVTPNDPLLLVTDIFEKYPKK